MSQVNDNLKNESIAANAKMAELIWNVESLARDIVKSIVDDPKNVLVTSSPSEDGLLIEIKVGQDDVGKIIGRQGRVANALRVLIKAVGAKHEERIKVNVFNTPLGA